MDNVPQNFNSWNKALQGAFKRGFKAAQDHINPKECPYKDKRNSPGKLTWSRAFISAWHDGYDWFYKELISEYFQDKIR